MLRCESVIPDNITHDTIQGCKEENSSRPFEWTYKTLCREENVKPLSVVQTYLQKNCLRFCVDHVNLKDWSPILNGITQDQSLSQISIYSRCHRKKIREKINTEEKLLKLRRYINPHIAKWQTDWHSARTSRRYTRKDQQQPVLYTNFLLRRFVQSLAVCLKNSLMITNLELDGIPLAPKYIKTLSDGLANNRNLQSLSLIRCRIGDAGCDLLLESLGSNPNLHILNLSSCCLTNRSATCLSSYLKKRRMDLLQNARNKSTLFRDDVYRPMKEGLQVLILDKNHKFSDIGVRHLIYDLKSDFWLKKLCLRFCGITERGGQIMLELLRTNSVIAQIDLKGNKVPADVLQTIYKLLKKRKNKWERILIQKKLLNHKHVRIQNMISKSTSAQFTSKNKYPENQDYPQLKIRDNCVSQVWCPTFLRKTINKNNKTRKLHDIGRRHVDSTNMQQLQKHLSLMIKRNQNLMTILENSADFLVDERNRSLNTEETYHKFQPRLKSLANKIAVQNSICTNTRYENQIYANLLNAFDKLTISTNEKKLRMADGNLKTETGESSVKSALHCRKSQLCENELAYLWHEISNFQRFLE